MIFTCPRCQSQLQIDGEPQPRLTCPICLCELRLRPKSPPPYPDVSFEWPTDHVALRDQANSHVVVLLLCGGVLFGFLMILQGFTSQGSETSVIFGLVLIFASCIAVGAVEWTTRPRRKVRETADPVDFEMPFGPPGQVPILNYHTPVQTPRDRVHGGMIFGLAFAGLMLGLGAIVALVSIRAWPLIFAIPIIGMALLFKRGARGFGIGLVMAIPFAMLIIIGICGGFLRL